MTLSRRYYACRHCSAKQTPWDQWAGVEQAHRVTPHARRMIVLAGSGCSFDEASRNLAELAHVQVSNDVVRRVCDEEGAQVQQWMNQSLEPKKAFEAAVGHVEFSSDGLKINTVEGWREIRQSVMCKRPAAHPVKPEKWADRVLEEPTVRMAICQIADCELIGQSWRRLAESLGIPHDQALSILGDGARWIWNQAAIHFKGADVQWVVDVYHLMLYLYAVVGGWEHQKRRDWVHQQIVKLIKLGGPRYIEHLKAVGPPDSSATEAWEKLLGYLRDNRDSLWYGRRLAEGLPIGSGLIEGGGKSTLARRLKINSARWCVDRAERMGAIRCLQYSGLWEPYWETAMAA